MIGFVDEVSDAEVLIRVLGESCVCDNVLMVGYWKVVRPYM
jgi:hypothetical protein